MDLGLHGAVFVVSGGSRGLGLATARVLVQEGARVVVAGRSRASVEAAVEQLGAHHAEGAVADLSDPASADHLVGAALGRFGRLDGALVSTGGPPAGTPTSTTDEQWRQGFESVLLGPLRLARAVIAAATSPASVCFVLSTSAKSPIAGLAVSNGLRPGLAVLVKDLADEVGPSGARVTAVLPGRVLTDRTASLDALSGDPDEVRAQRSATIPLRRYGDPVELGRVAAFLLSPAASYVTGALVPVDGGALRAL